MFVRAGRTKLAESPNRAYSCSKPYTGSAKKNWQTRFAVSCGELVSEKIAHLLWILVALYEMAFSLVWRGKLAGARYSKASVLLEREEVAIEQQGGEPNQSGLS